MSRPVLIAGIVMAQLVSAGTAPRVAIIKSSSVGPFNQAAEAIAQALRRDLLQPEILTFDLDGDESRAATVLAEVRRARVQLIITIGSLATAVTLKEPPSAPVVFSMVLYPRQSGFLAEAERPVTGVSLDVPLDVQFKYLRRLFPAAQRVGVLHDPAETGAIIDEAREAAAAQGLDLIAETVREPSRVVAALENVMDRVDVMWSVADSHVFTPQTTSALILAALRRRMPLFGLSTAHVRAGALATLYCDYDDIGAQTGDVALRVLHNEKASRIPVSTPRTLALALNLKTAHHLGMSIPRELEAEAREVIR